MPVETEIKLRAQPDFELPDLAGSSPDLQPTPPRTFELDAVYYDTSTLALARSHVTLRSRVGEDAPVWTLKLPTDGNGGGALARGEHTFDGPIGVVPETAKQAVLALTRGEPLAPVLRLHTTRTELTVSFRGQPVAKIVDDRVAGELDGPSSEPFREVEVEMIGDNEPAIIEPVIATLVDRGCERETDPMPKAIRMLGPRAVDPPDVDLPVVTKRSSLQQFLSAIVAGPVRQVIEHHAGTVLGDVDAVHDFRVATRRLRSNIKTFGALVDPTWATWLRDELAWLGGEVGIERDAGVLAAHLGEQAKTLPAQDAPAIEELFAEVHEDGTSAHQHVLEALHGDRYLALLEAMVNAARAPRLAAPLADRGDEPAVAHVLPLVRKPWRKLKGAAECLTPESSDPAYHAARIRAKRARYAAEAVVPLFGGAARRYARAVEKIQSILGEHQDAVVAEQWLRDAATRAPAAGVAAGELAALQRMQRVKLRRQFRSAWKKAARPKLRTWMRRR